jgi:hypothetical protein
MYTVKYKSYRHSCGSYITQGYRKLTTVQEK